MFTIVRNRVGCNWLILFGAGPVHTRSVLAACTTRREAQDLLHSWT